MDEFIALGHAAMADPASEYIAFVEPGNVVTRRVGPARRSHRRTGQGAAPPAADAGLPPDARRPHRHHHGQHRRRPGQRQDHHRPHRRAAPARLDHAGPLRRPAQQPAARRLRAGPRLCARRPCARRRAAAVGADSRAGRDAGGARIGRGRGHAAQGPRAQARAAHRHRGQHRQPQLGAAARQPARSAASARAARLRWTWRAPPSPPTAFASACPTARCCA